MKKFVILLILLFCIGVSSCESGDDNVVDVNETTAQEVKKIHQTYDVLRETIMVGKGTEWSLLGELTLPKDYEGKMPAVVLVHGSGPSDMDETIFDNKPFLDIANELSFNGIAVIRYNKRTFVHAKEMLDALGGELTVYEETIEDAILAAEMLKADPRIDENRVFIIGHSMGGMLAPRIHAEGGNFAGIISLAGSPRSINDIIYDQQIAYVDAMEEGEEKENYLSQVMDKEAFDEAIAEILNLPDDEAKTNMVWSNSTSAYYYKDWEKISVADYVKNINIPFLIMQGSADFQVSIDKDFAAWQELFAGRSNAVFKLYDNLNHYFMQSAGRTIMDFQEEYKIKGNVDAQVLIDMADWINAN